MESNVGNLTYRALSDGELDTWSLLCEQAFAEKERPPLASYFRRHFDNDPEASLNLIFVCQDLTTGKLVGSVRIFNRSVYSQTSKHIIDTPDNGSYLSIAGVGEVCTLKEYRGRGIARKLLKMALETSKHEHHFSVAMLHAAIGMQPFYSQLGFQSVTTSWVRFHIDYLTSSNLQNCDNLFSIQRIDMETHDDEALSILSKQLSSKFPYGPIVKQPLYIKSWVAKEAAGQIVGVYMKEAHSDNSELVAYAVLKEYPRGCIQVHDFGCSSNCSPSTVLQYILIQGRLQLSPLKDLSYAYIPLPLVQSYLSECVIDCEIAHDYGWMILDLNVHESHDGMKETSTNMLSLFSQNHLYFPIDNY